MVELVVVATADRSPAVGRSSVVAASEAGAVATGVAAGEVVTAAGEAVPIDHNPDP